MRCKNSKEREEDGGKVLKRDQGKKKRERGRKTERCYRVKREFVLNTCYARFKSVCVRVRERSREGVAEVRGAGGARACFIKCVARGKSARQFSGAKGSADNARPHLKQSVTLFDSLFSPVSRIHSRIST